MKLWQFEFLCELRVLPFCELCVNNRFILNKSKIKFMGVTERTELILILAGLAIVLFFFITGFTTGYLLGRRSERKNISQ